MVSFTWLLNTPSSRLNLLSTIELQEEEQYLRERDRYELEKGRLIREMKRLRDEDGSRFNNFQILHHRYALLNLLGKGGFSEVYKVYSFFSYIFLFKRRL